MQRLQSEIIEEYGSEGLPPKPPNARERVVVTLRKEFTLKPEFQQLWERIKYHTRYAVKIDTEKLVEDVVRELDQVKIAAPQVMITKVHVEVDEKDHLDTYTIAAHKGTALDLSGRMLSKCH